MIIRVFLFGMAIALVAAFAEIGILKFFQSLFPQWVENNFFYFFVLYNFLGIALVEEFTKYLVVWQKVLNHSEFDEPVDTMLYMIISALGFAALENLLILLPGGKPFLFAEVLTTSALRFIGATLLHALCSGTLGYFLALSFCETKRRRAILVIWGLTLASFLHGLYNFSIMETTRSPMFWLVPLIILIGLAIFVIYKFEKIKELKSVCKVNLTK
jgi:RsiW-degrading membrane proteinase PrsW (M82 family)